MSKNSHKALYTQLMEWLPTLSSKRKKPVKRGNIQPRFTNYDVKIKNGSNARR
jgi:hypothetical protein